MGESTEILDNRKTHCEWLYQDRGTPKATCSQTGENEQKILLNEESEVANSMKKYKTPGCNGIETEL